MWEIVKTPNNQYSNDPWSFNILSKTWGDLHVKLFLRAENLNTVLNAKIRLSISFLTYL